MLFLMKIVLHLFFFREINVLFVKLGNYPDHSKFDVNLPECGLGIVPTVHKVYYTRKCFANVYKNRSIISIDNEYEIREQVMNRIYRSRDAQIGEAPWTVLIRFDNGYECTGFLITFEWVMTAAHCLVNNPGGAVIHAGSNRRVGDYQIRIDTNKIFPHPIYTDPSQANTTLNLLNATRSSHDIGMVKLQEKYKQINEGQHYMINTICLPNESPLNTNEENSTFTGFGQINERGELSDRLQIADIKLLPTKECPSFLCSIRLGSHDLGNIPRPCPGDSGGPLFQYTEGLRRAVLIGVYKGSKGLPNDICGAYASKHYFVSPITVIPWILDTIKTN